MLLKSLFGPKADGTKLIYQFARKEHTESHARTHTQTLLQQLLVQRDELQVRLWRGVVVPAEGFQETHGCLRHALVRVCHVVGDALAHRVLWLRTSGWARIHECVKSVLRVGEVMCLLLVLHHVDGNALAHRFCG